MIDFSSMKNFRPVCRMLAACLLGVASVAGLYGCSGVQAAPETTFVLLDGSKQVREEIVGHEADDGKACGGTQ